MANATVVTGTAPAIISANPCKLIGIYPIAVTTGTVSVIDGLTTLFTYALGLPQAGMTFGVDGFRVGGGLTIDLSVNEPVLVLWAPLL